GARARLRGGAGGLGRAVARALHVRGTERIISGRRGEVLEPLAGELSARSLVVDLSVPAEVERLAQDAGEVDILVANAALPAAGTLDSFSVEEIDRALDINLRAPIVLAHALSPGMVTRGKGHLLFMSSLAGKAATPATALYNASKYG